MYLKTLIDEIVKFGINEKLDYEDKTAEVQRLLAGIYSEYLKMNPEFDTKDYIHLEKTNTKAIRNIVTTHFPEFGWYHSVWECHKLMQEPQLIVNDAVDDLSDIITDLIEVKWRLENTSQKDGLWHFHFLMKNHSEKHLLELLNYLKDKNE